jgi:IPT/TIG domain
MQNKAFRSFSLKLFIWATAWACVEENVATRDYPVVDTRPTAEVTTSGALLQGEILNVGESGVRDHGFVYGTTFNPAFATAEIISLGDLAKAGRFSALANRSLIKDVKYFVKAYAVSKGGKVVYGQEKEFKSLGSLPPQIGDIFPLVASVEDTLLILGTGFSNIKTLNTVYFESFFANIVRSNADTIWCKVPEAVPVGSSDISLTVGQHTVKSPIKFRLATVELTRFLKDTISFGDTLTIQGKNFALTKEYNRVEILGQPALVVEANRTQLKAVVPSQVNVPSSIVKLTLGSQTVSTTKKTFLHKPIITSISPLTGSKGSEITLTGDHFSPAALNNQVTLNSTALPVLQASRKSLTVKLPDLIPADYKFVVTVATQSVTSSQTFTAKGPILFSVEPKMATWNDLVTITGKGFAISPLENTVKFGSIAAEVVSSNDSEIKVKVPPALLIKESQITVQSSTLPGFTAIFTTPFTLSNSQIFDFNPKDGKSGSEITITGVNFNPVPENQLVKFGDYEAQVLESTGNSLKVQLPKGLVDSEVSLRITIAGQQLSAFGKFHLVSPWKKLKDFAGGEIARGTTFTVSGNGYVVGGLYGSNKVWKYNSASDGWTEVKSIDLYGYDMFSFTINNEAYVGLPADGSGKNMSNSFKKYDPATDTWTDLQTSGAPLITRACGFSMDGKGYIVGGVFPFAIPPYGTSYMSTSATFQYDPTTNTWLQKSFLSLGFLRGFADAAGFEINNRFFLSAREYNDNTTNVFGEYDAVADVWTQRSGPPGKVGASGFSIDGLGYQVGGAYPNSTGKEFWIYNGLSQTWTQADDFPGAARAEAIVFVVGQKAYYGTGRGINGNLKDMWEFDPSKQ